MPKHPVSAETRAKISATLKRKGIRPPTDHLTPEVRAKISATLRGRKQDETHRAAKRGKFGPDASAWKGDAATKEAKHMWLVKHHPKSGRCEECGTDAKTQYAFLRHPKPYTRDRADYAELCDPCHRDLDKAHRYGWG